MFDERKFFINTIDQKQVVPFKGDQGSRSVPAFANYSTIVAAQSIFETCGMSFDLPKDKDILEIKKENSFPIKNNSTKGEVLPVIKDAVPPMLTYYPRVEESTKAHKGNIGTITIHDDYLGDVKITRTVRSDENEERPLESAIYVNFSKNDVDGGCDYIRVVVPVTYESETHGTLHKAMIDQIYYDKDSMAVSSLENAEESIKSPHSDTFAEVQTHMWKRDIIPDYQRQLESEPQFTEFSSVDDQKALVDFMSQLTQLVVSMQKERVASKAK